MKFNMVVPLPWKPSSVFLAADQSLGSVCPGLAEPRSRSELASADQCQKFCDDTLSAKTILTLNNPCNLHPDCLLYFISHCKVIWPQKQSVFLAHPVHETYFFSTLGSSGSNFSYSKTSRKLCSNLHWQIYIRHVLLYTCWLLCLSAETTSQQPKPFRHVRKMT